MILQLVFQLICIQVSYDDRIVSGPRRKVRNLLPLLVQKTYKFQALDMRKMLVEFGYYFKVGIQNGDGPLSVEGAETDDYLLGFDLLKIIVPVNLHIRYTLNSIHPIPELRLEYLFRNSFILIQTGKFVDDQRRGIPTGDEHLLIPIKRNNTHRINQVLPHVDLGFLANVLHRMHGYLPLGFTGQRLTAADNVALLWGFGLVGHHAQQF